MKTAARSGAWSFASSLIEPMVNARTNQTNVDGAKLQKDVGVANRDMANGTSGLYRMRIGIGNAIYDRKWKQQVAKRRKERRRIHHIGWLPGAVLAANEGATSNASVILGVAAAHATHANILLSGIAALLGGALSMATLEYVSVTSKPDTENLPLAKLPPGRQAALASARNFMAGAALPLAVAAVAPEGARFASVAVATLAFLVVLNGLAAKTAGAKTFGGVGRVAFSSALAMGIAAGIGAVFGWQA
jgi:VIT1/CCC1 family predicted Fe2+/Mn2+ transporter